MTQTSRPISLRQVKIKDSFWKKEMELVRKEVIPYQWNALNDRVEGAAPSFCMRNFKIAGKITAERKRLGKDYKEIKWPIDIFEPLPEDMEHMEDRFYGFLFQDSDFSKWIEAVGYSLTQHPDEQLENIADEAIDIVCAAQQENGYLDTYYIINDMDGVFTNLKDHHELYCFGHLTEGAVAYYEATGKDKLLRAACRYADYIDQCFGPEEDKKKGYPGHEIAEMALMRLYEVTKEEKYKKLAAYFLNERGKRPYYFDTEKDASVKKGTEQNERYHYYQAHRPVKEQDEAVGHAVRAVYLYSGMADLARATGDEQMKAACDRLWDDITGKKLYVTGGIGGTHVGEAFSFRYDLPNDTAYSETCAAIGLVFFARRMLEMKADRKYSDIMELALYNTVLAGMALDGKSFFYVNPLEVNPTACHKDERKFHVKPVRQKWFGCACCPPNIARLVSSVASYAYTENEDTLFAHLYVGGEVEKKLDEQSSLCFEVETDMPWSGKTVYTCTEDSKKDAVLAVRIPGWCKSYTINLAGEEKDGYVYLKRNWKAGDQVVIDLAMETELLTADLQVREDIGKAAIKRGPFTYCLEEADNGNRLYACSVYADAAPKINKMTIAGHDVMTITIAGRKQKEQTEETCTAMPLYKALKKPSYTDCELTFIPYYTWANRGENEMCVWVSYDFKGKNNDETC